MADSWEPMRTADARRFEPDRDWASDPARPKDASPRARGPLCESPSSHARDGGPATGPRPAAPSLRPEAKDTASSSCPDAPALSPTCGTESWGGPGGDGPLPDRDERCAEAASSPWLPCRLSGPKPIMSIPSYVGAMRWVGRCAAYRPPAPAAPPRRDRHPAFIDPAHAVTLLCEPSDSG